MTAIYHRSNNVRPYDLSRYLLDPNFKSKVNPKITKVSEACKDHTFKAYVQNAIDDVNKNDKVVVSNACKIQYFVILPRDFSIETGELSSTMKLRRGETAKIWANELEGLYQ